MSKLELNEPAHDLRKNDALSSSDDVFRHFLKKRGVDADGDMDAIALFAYALVEKDRIDWVDHFKAMHDGTYPSAGHVIEWFRAKPESYLDEKEGLAVNWYTAFSRSLLSDEIEDAKNEAIRETIGNLQRFWPTFWSGNFIGITSNIAFAFLLVGFVMVITTDFSFIAWAKALIAKLH
jgi:hypothetical protein